jgi:hypothetical protein
LVPLIMPSLHFPSVGHQVLSCLVHLLGVSILSFCFARRVGTLRGLTNLTWPRLCIILLFIDSWLFLFSSGILIFGVGLEFHEAVCSTGVFACIFFYATSKLFVYFFLIERVHVVWMPATGIKRFKSRVYIICFVTVCAYAVVIGLMVVGRINYYREGDSVCVLGLRPISSYPLLIYDLYINIFLTSMFFLRLRRARLNARLKRIAIHALMSAAVALTTSTTNIVILGVVGGTEIGWLCLASCSIDVLINALSIFWVTGVMIGQHSTISVYSEGDNQFKPAPVQSILKRPSTAPSPSRVGQAYSPSDTECPTGRHRITSIYYRYKEDSTTFSSFSRPVETISLNAPTSSYIQDPPDPFARASWMPRALEPQVQISADPDPKNRSPSALRSITERLRHDPEVINVEIKVTTATDIESVSPSSVDIPCSAKLQVPPPSRTRLRSCSV